MDLLINSDYWWLLGLEIILMSSFQVCYKESEIETENAPTPFSTAWSQGLMQSTLSEILILKHLATGVESAEIRMLMAEDGASSGLLGFTAAWKTQRSHRTGSEDSLKKIQKSHLFPSSSLLSLPCCSHTWHPRKGWVCWGMEGLMTQCMGLALGLWTDPHQFSECAPQLLWPLEEPFI